MALLTTAAGLLLGAPAAAAPLGFSKPILVDPGLAGGEPLVLPDPLHGTLIYTSHEGTTHLYRNGLVTTEPAFYTNYRDQVNVWTSTDGGLTWKFTSYNGTGFTSNPAENLGFSDPDLTEDGGGRIYNTGIDLANDALFSTIDGGRTWDRGTIQCHDGDRPWLAGGQPNEVFLATNANTGGPDGSGGHLIFRSSDGGNSCSSQGIPDQGTTAAGQFIGDGKLAYVRDRDMLVEPIAFKGAGVGVSTWHRGDPAFAPGPPATKSPIISHWPAIALDAADTLYEVWDTDPRRADKMGCSDASPTQNGNSGSPLANQIQYAYSKDFGKSWSAPVTVAAPPNGRAFWPWIVAGDAGKVNIVWYQSDKVVDLDCQASKISIFSATVLKADSPSPAVQTVDAAGRPIHDGGVCQGGTTCVATGQDRRLGDFFTNALLPDGCVAIASGDTTHHDPLTGGPLPTSLPIFLRQTSGPALLGDGDCSGLPAKTSGVAGAHRACRDITPPVSRFAPHGIRVSRRHLVVGGTSRDAGCRRRGARVAGRVARVLVAVAKRASGHRCRFLRGDGTLSPLRSCGRPVFLRARGTTTWHLDYVVRLAPGTYEVRVRGVDARGNGEHRSARTVRRVRVR